MKKKTSTSRIYLAPEKETPVGHSLLYFPLGSCEAGQQIYPHYSSIVLKNVLSESDYVNLMGDIEKFLTQHGISPTEEVLYIMNPLALFLPYFYMEVRMKWLIEDLQQLVRKRFPTTRLKADIVYVPHSQTLKSTSKRLAYDEYGHLLTKKRTLLPFSKVPCWPPKGLNLTLLVPNSFLRDNWNRLVDHHHHHNEDERSTPSGSAASSEEAGMSMPGESLMPNVDGMVTNPSHA